jgi:hypothetical protein
MAQAVGATGVGTGAGASSPLAGWMGTDHIVPRGSEPNDWIRMTLEKGPLGLCEDIMGSLVACTALLSCGWMGCITDVDVVIHEYKC